MKFLALSFILLCAPGALLDFALEQWKADKAVRIEDAYKWLFQATQGGEHAVPDEQAAREWLENEWKTLGPAQENEPLWEPLCSNDGGEESDNIGRLNLRPFRDRGGKKEDLLAVFVASSKNFTPDKAAFIGAWNELGKRLKKKSQGNLRSKDWKKFDAEMKAKNYGAVHHSKDYVKAKQPAYRVVTGAEAQKLMLNLRKR